MTQAPSIAVALSDAERNALNAAIEWWMDQTCSNAYAALDDAMQELFRLRRERRQSLREAA